MTVVINWDNAISDVTNWYNIELFFSGKSSGISESDLVVVAFWDILSVQVCSQYRNSSTFDIETVLAF